MHFGKVMLDDRIGQFVVRQRRATLSQSPEKADIIIFLLDHFSVNHLKQHRRF